MMDQREIIKYLYIGGPVLLCELYKDFILPLFPLQNHGTTAFKKEYRDFNNYLG